MSDLFTKGRLLTNVAGCGPAGIVPTEPITLMMVASAMCQSSVFCGSDYKYATRAANLFRLLDTPEKRSAAVLLDAGHALLGLCLNVPASKEAEEFAKELSTTCMIYTLGERDPDVMEEALSVRELLIKSEIEYYIQSASNTTVKLHKKSPATVDQIVRELSLANSQPDEAVPVPEEQPIWGTPYTVSSFTAVPSVQPVVNAVRDEIRQTTAGQNEQVRRDVSGTNPPSTPLVWGSVENFVRRYNPQISRPAEVHPGLHSDPEQRNG